VRKQAARSTHGSHKEFTHQRHPDASVTRQDKTRDVDSAYAATRMEDAQAYLQQAQISLDYVEGTRRYATVVSAAVIAGIAATDVVCARTLGKVSASRRRFRCELDVRAGD